MVAVVWRGMCASVCWWFGRTCSVAPLARRVLLQEDSCVMRQVRLKKLPRMRVAAPHHEGGRPREGLFCRFAVRCTTYAGRDDQR